MNLQQIQKLETKVQKNKDKFLNLPEHEILNDQILIYTVVFEEQGEVVVPQSYEDKASYGIVVGVGGGRYTDNGVLITPNVSVGDFVLFGKYGTVKERVNGVDFHYIRNEDIVSRIPIE